MITVVVSTCILLQAVRVTDLSANDSQCRAVMEKTHVGPMGGGIEVPGPHRGRQAWSVFKIIC